MVGLWRASLQEPFQQELLRHYFLSREVQFKEMMETMLIKHVWRNKSFLYSNGSFRRVKWEILTGVVKRWGHRYVDLLQVLQCFRMEQAYRGTFWKSHPYAPPGSYHMGHAHHRILMDLKSLKQNRGQWDYIRYLTSYQYRSSGTFSDSLSSSGF